MKSDMIERNAFIDYVIQDSMTFALSIVVAVDTLVADYKLREFSNFDLFLYFPAFP